MMTDGTLACWGDNGWGQATPPGGTFSQVSGGNAHTCGVRTDGTLACWGNNDNGQATPPGGTFSQVSAGTYHSCGLRTEGTLACWGAPDWGMTTPPGGTFSQVSAGLYHTCGVRTDATLARCWGNNDNGQATPPGGTFSQVSAGHYHTCGVRTDGTLGCWGNNNHGQATPPGGTIVIMKVTGPAGGSGFGFSDNIAAPNSFSLDHGSAKTFSNVFTDSYVVIENDPQVTPGSFVLTNIGCTDPDGGSSVDLGARKATVDLDVGETVTCTFINALDTDGDGVPDEGDNCPLASNPDQTDTDTDGRGDACDVCANDPNDDADSDGICLGSGYLPPKTGDNDNCPLVANTDQTNTDGDAQGDACDADDDNDTVLDATDTDPLDPYVCQDVDTDTCDDCSVLGYPNASQDGTDTDTYGACNIGDPDDDNDTVADGDDTDPLDAFVCQDLDTDTCDVPRWPGEGLREGPSPSHDGRARSWGTPRYLPAAGQGAHRGTPGTTHARSLASQQAGLR